MIDNLGKSTAGNWSATHARNNRYFSTAKEFRQQIDKFFEATLPEIADALNSRINDNFQTFSFAK